MPRQVGPVFIEGTFGDLIFYKLGEHYYVRQKPARKKRKEMERDERYARTLQKADQFRVASRLTKWAYYRYVVKTVRRHGLFGELTGLVNRRLQAGEEAEAVKAWLIGYCKGLGAATVAIVKSVSTVSSATMPVASTSTATPVSMPAVKNVSQPVHKSGNKWVRILSKWKVNRRGRLQTPREAKALAASPATVMDCS